MKFNWKEFKRKYLRYDCIKVQRGTELSYVLLEPGDREEIILIAPMSWSGDCEGASLDGFEDDDEFEKIAEASMFFDGVKKIQFSDGSLYNPMTQSICAFVEVVAKVETIKKL